MLDRRSVEADAIGAFAEELFDPARTAPIVGVTTLHRQDRTLVDVDDLARACDGHARVVVLETGPATWRLAELLGPELGVFGGALRVWFPGLTRDAEPYGHPLLFTDQGRAASAVRRVLDLVGAAEEGRTSPDVVHEARVVRAGAADLRVEVEGELLRVVAADVPLDALAAAVVEGDVLRVRVVGPGRASCRDVYPPPWDVVRDTVRAGDVVLGRVVGVKPQGAIVEILPRVRGFVHVSHVDWLFVRHPSEFVQPGEVCAVLVRDVGPEEQSLELSIKEAVGREPTLRPSVIPGGRPYLAERETAREAAVEGNADAGLAERLAAAERDRARALEQVAELKARVRSLEDRVELAERRGIDPARSEREFLAAVRVVYAVTHDEDDRARHPLRRMRVGPDFLASLHALEGIDPWRVAEVACEAAADRAKHKYGRLLHRLGRGEAGPDVTRTRDGAAAWRCAIQAESPSARRLHWWEIAGPDGPTIEFANAVLHDDFSITE